MHQDSQNFSDVMAIDPAKQLKVHLILATHGELDYTVTINDQTITEMESVIHLNLFDDVDLKIVINENKNNAAVEIKSLKINEKEVLPLYQHLASENTSWITQGEWNYYITSPFYSWYHNASGQGWIA